MHEGYHNLSKQCQQGWLFDVTWVFNSIKSHHKVGIKVLIACFFNGTLIFEHQKY